MFYFHRFEEYVTDAHLVFYVFDHRRQLQSEQQDDGECWPSLPQGLGERARMSSLIDAYAVESAEFEIGGGSSWPKSVFRSSLVNMAPKDYWCHVEKLATTGGYSCAGFAAILYRLCAVPPSNAAVERRFSAAALEQTALRNRLSAETLEKLLRVGGVKEEQDDEEDCAILL